MLNTSITIGAVVHRTRISYSVLYTDRIYSTAQYSTVYTEYSTVCSAQFRNAKIIHINDSRAVPQFKFNDKILIMAL